MRELRKKKCNAEVEDALFETLKHLASSVDPELLQAFLEDSVRAAMSPAPGAVDKTSWQIARVSEALGELEEKAEPLALAVQRLYQELRPEDEQFFKVFLDVMPFLPKDALEDISSCDRNSEVTVFPLTTLVHYDLKGPLLLAGVKGAIFAPPVHPLPTGHQQRVGLAPRLAEQLRRTGLGEPRPHSGLAQPSPGRHHWAAGKVPAGTCGAVI